MCLPYRLPVLEQKFLSGQLNQFFPFTVCATHFDDYISITLRGNHVIFHLQEDVFNVLVGHATELISFDSRHVLLCLSSVVFVLCYQQTSRHIK